MIQMKMAMMRMAPFGAGADATATLRVRGGGCGCGSSKDDDVAPDAHAQGLPGVKQAQLPVGGEAGGSTPGKVEALRSEVAAARGGDEAAAGGGDKWTAAAWLASCGVSASIASALHGGAADELAAMRALGGKSEAELLERLREASLLETLARELHGALQRLNSSEAATGAELHGKFMQDGQAFELKYADLSTFFGGLEAKIGPPDPHVYEQMEREHTAAADSDVEFTTGNYAVTTKPKFEWWFVADPENKDRPESWPDEQALLRESAPDRMRKPLPIRELERKLADKNRELQALREPKLLLDEAIGARLYTGPMFAKYNDLLRNFGRHLDGCLGNRYVTTTHVINSCIVKTSKLTQVARVYRGVASGVLPEQFWTPNEQGVRGGVESAFLSTTYDREVARGYASKPGKPGILFEVQMGMIDRGAELDWLSQYPHEKECLFAPLTGFELQQTRVEGSVLIAEVRLHSAASRPERRASTPARTGARRRASRAVVGDFIQVVSFKLRMQTEHKPRASNFARARHRPDPRNL